MTLVAADSAPARARWTARRLEGDTIPMVIPADKRIGFMGKLFGRRAA